MVKQTDVQINGDLMAAGWYKCAACGAMFDNVNEVRRHFVAEPNKQLLGLCRHLIRLREENAALKHAVQSINSEKVPLGRDVEGGLRYG